MTLRSSVLGTLVGLAIVLPISAHAVVTDATFTASGNSAVGNHGALAAQVEFQLSLNANSALNTVKVTLTNTVSPNVYEPADLLSAVIFQFNTSTSLNNANQHVFVASGSALTDGSTPSNIDIGYQFLVVNGSSFGMAGNAYGFSSTGLGIFGQSNFMDNSGNSLGGSDYNITHNGSTLHGNPGSPLVDNAVCFSLNAPNVMDLSTLDHVAFQYGTAISEGHTTGHPKVLTPEPVTSSLVGMSAIAFVRRRLRRKTA